MSGISQIRKMNELAETAKYQARARAMNTKESHPKKAASCKRCDSKGRVLACPPGRKFPVVAVKCPECS